MPCPGSEPRFLRGFFARSGAGSLAAISVGGLVGGREPRPDGVRVDAAIWASADFAPSVMTCVPPFAGAAAAAGAPPLPFAAPPPLPLPPRWRRPELCAGAAARCLTTGSWCTMTPRPAQTSHGSLKVSSRPEAELLAGHLHEAERGDLGDLVLRAVAAQALHQAPQHEVAVGLEHHVDEVDDDDAADVAQAQLADDLLRGLEVVLGDGLLEVAAGADELAGVDVDDRHRLGAVDHEGSAGGQPHLAVQRLLDLLGDPVHVERVAGRPRTPRRGPAGRGRRSPGRCGWCGRASAPWIRIRVKSSLNTSRTILTSRSGSACSSAGACWVSTCFWM